MIQRQPTTSRFESPSEPLDTWSWLRIMGWDTPLFGDDESATATRVPVGASRLPIEPQALNYATAPRDLTLTVEEEKAVANAIATERCALAKERLFFHGLHVLTRIVNAYEGRGLTTADLIENGARGLRCAVNNFDPSQGVRFSTTASWWIKQAIRNALAERRELIVSN